MDSHKLKVFCAVVQVRSFSEAAKLLNLSQPAVSLQVRALEQTCEAVLFDRSSRVLKLTPTGELVHRYAQRILALHAEMDAEVNALAGQIKEELSIGASTTAGNYLLPHVIVAFRKLHPKVKMDLKVGNTKEVVRLLTAGDIALGIVEGDVSREGVTVETLVRDELVLIMAPEHPWATRRSIPVADLIGEQVIFREPGSGTRQIVEKRLHERHLSVEDLKISMVLGNTEAIKTAVEQGMGVAIVSAWAVRKEVKQGTIHAARFSDIRFDREFSLIHFRPHARTRGVSAFLDFVKQFPFSARTGHGER
ncbi:MAG TPA: selenium metabolism-associated LysR family transcriptional regulator [Longimicrobiaceae bacterium]|nr:selenium metabolism-associated LysR family transcriptional regulator [Longimicrobiaceae bacterium]